MCEKRKEPVEPVLFSLSFSVIKTVKINLCGESKSNNERMMACVKRMCVSAC